MNRSSIKEKKSIWTPSKIALAALAGVSIAFVAYQAFSKPAPERVNRPLAPKPASEQVDGPLAPHSKICFLSSLPTEKRYEVVANKLKVAYQRACPSNKTILNEIDELIRKIDAENQSICSFLSSVLGRASRCDERFEAIVEIRDRFLSLNPAYVGQSWDMRMAASPTCTTDEG